MVIFGGLGPASWLSRLLLFNVLVFVKWDGPGLPRLHYMSSFHLFVITDTSGRLNDLLCQDEKRQMTLRILPSLLALSGCLLCVHGFFLRNFEFFNFK